MRWIERGRPGRTRLSGWESMKWIWILLVTSRALPHRCLFPLPFAWLTRNLFVSENRNAEAWSIRSHLRLGQEGFVSGFWSLRGFDLVLFHAARSIAPFNANFPSSMLAKQAGCDWRTVEWGPSVRHACSVSFSLTHTLSRICPCPSFWHCKPNNPGLGPMQPFD